MINGKFSCKMGSIPLAEILAAKIGGKWSIDRNLAARWGVIH
jgi:hypothetical protein